MLPAVRGVGAVVTVSPRDFPVMWTPRQWFEAHRGDPRPFHVCRVCRLAIDPRNSMRHQKACLRRKRDAPELWAEWHADMHAS